MCWSRAPPSLKTAGLCRTCFRVSRSQAEHTTRSGAASAPITATSVAVASDRDPGARAIPFSRRIFSLTLLPYGHKLNTFLPVTDVSKPNSSGGIAAALRCVSAVDQLVSNCDRRGPYDHAASTSKSFPSLIQPMRRSAVDSPVSWDRLSHAADGFAPRPDDGHSGWHGL